MVLSKTWAMPNDTQYTEEDLSAMDRDEVKAIADDLGLEYSPHAHTETLIRNILDTQEGEGEEAEAEAEEGVEATAEEEVVVVADPYKTTYSPYELPANTAAAEAFRATNPEAVDPEAVLSDERTAQAQDHIATYGADDDPRLEGYTPSQEIEEEEEPAEEDVEEE